MHNPWDYITSIEENGNVYTLPNRNISFYLPLLRKDAIQKIIARNEDFFDIETLLKLKKYIPPKAFILDIGANIGNHSLFFAKECHAKSVYSFEPVKSTYITLERNIKINKLENCTTFNCAIGEKSKGKANLVSFSEANTGASTVRPCDRGDIDIISIDSLHITTPVDFVKIDVEGYELNVLKGMKNTIERYTPILYVEIFSNNFYAVKNYLENKGYANIVEITEDNYLFINRNKTVK